MIEFVMLLGLASVVAIVSLGFLDKIRDKYSNNRGSEKEAQTPSLEYKGYTINAGMPYIEAKVLLKHVAQDYLAVENKKKGFEKQIESEFASFKEYAKNESSKSLKDMKKQSIATKIHKYQLNIELLNTQLNGISQYGKVLGAIVKKYESAIEAKKDTTPDLRKHVEPKHAPV